MKKIKQNEFVIPVMSIQDILFGIEGNSELLSLFNWLDEQVEQERGNWGISGKGYYVDYDLERRWYPIFIINNRWLADAFVKYVGNKFNKENT